MSKIIRINHPGDGQWVMDRCHGVFQTDYDNVIATARAEDGMMLGGVVVTSYLYGAVCMHMAGTGDNWGTPDFLWMVFDYTFNQLGCRKIIGLVDAENELALAIDRKLGFREEARIANMTWNGGDLVVLAMDKHDCRWLKLKPRRYRSNHALETA